MNRPPAEPLTERELEVMHVFWPAAEMSAQQARDQLELKGRLLTYTTVATLCRILWEKGFLERVGQARPFTFRPAKSFQEVSGHLVSDLVRKVFQGSREQLLLHMVGDDQLSAKKRKLLEEFLREEGEDASC